jgi:hypothetical protein
VTAAAAPPASLPRPTLNLFAHPTARRCPGDGAGFRTCIVEASVNGLVIVRFRLPPFFATLGMFTIIAVRDRADRAFARQRRWLLRGNVFLRR